MKWPLVPVVVLTTQAVVEVANEPEKPPLLFLTTIKQQSEQA